MIIREAQIMDIDQLTAIEERCFTSRWTRDMFAYEIEENPFGKFYVLEEEGTLLGFIDFWITFETCQLANIAVDLPYRGKGLSRILMDKMIEIANEEGCETIMLEVRPSNTTAITLYENYEFLRMNIRKGYYSDNGEDAIVMCKALGGK